MFVVCVSFGQEGLFFRQEGLAKECTFKIEWLRIDHLNLCLTTKDLWKPKKRERLE